MIEDCVLGEGVVIPHPELVNLYRCTIGAGTLVGPFVEIQAGVVVGRDCKIESHSFLCSGVTIGDRVFVGHGVMTINDKWPHIDRSILPPFSSRGDLETVIEDDVVIGSGSVLMPVRVGRWSMIGAGAVVTKDVPAGVIVVGNPGEIWACRPALM